MCRKLVVTNEIFLGTRAICYEAYSLPKHCEPQEPICHVTRHSHFWK